MRAVLCVLLAAGLQASQVVPPRDTRPTSPSSVAAGRAVIRGRVFAADTGRPLARATVSVSAQLGRVRMTRASARTARDAMNSSIFQQAAIESRRLAWAISISYTASDTLVSDGPR